MKAHWRLLTSWDEDPGRNMALDEALLLHGPQQPTLRFYTWSPDTLSLGYFQRLADVPPAAGFVKTQTHGTQPERPVSTEGTAHKYSTGTSANTHQDPAYTGQLPGAVVRRLTGGGAIHHKRELTFSITAPLDHPLYRGKIEDSYKRVHGAIARALAAIGVVASERGQTQLASEREDTGMCFHKSAAVDLIWDNKKGVGSAQRRKQSRVLHHGSIKLGTTNLEGNIATPQVQITPAGFAPHLLAAMQSSFDMQTNVISEQELTPEVQAHAKARTAHFTSKAFLARK